MKRQIKSGSFRDVSWNANPSDSNCFELFPEDNKSKVLLVSYVLSLATTKAEGDLSSLSCLFLCVEWDTPPRPNWLANQNVRFQSHDNKKQEDGGHFFVYLSIKMGMLHMYLMNITVLNVMRHNADKHSCLKK